jgi:nicotinamidase-related amidase
MHQQEDSYVPAKNHDLHGNAPDTATVALLLIDVINDLEFIGGEDLLAFALPMATRIAALKQRAKRARIPVVYVNDNFGKWQSDLQKLVRHCLEDGVRGEPVVRLLQPDDEDYFVLKPKASGFYCTTLELLLEYLHVSTLILTGMAGNICVQFTANDAYLRDFQLFIPADCVASRTREENNVALTQMQRLLRADISESLVLDLHQLNTPTPRK